MNSLVSIIIPSYNCERYVSEAIESALAQTYKNIEIIVVDDGSTDNTESAVKPYVNRVQYIKKSNGGPASARNIGIKHAKGEFLAFLDADDCWRPEKIEKQMSAMKRYPKVGMVACHQYVTNSEMQIIGEVKYPNYSKRSIFIKQMIVRNGAGGGSGCLIRGSSIKKVGLFDENLRGTEDWDMWLRIVMEYDIYFVDEFLVKARLLNNSVSSPANTAKMLHNELKLLDKIFGNRDYHFTAWQSRKSYGYRHFVAAKGFKVSGDLKAARQHILKSFSLFPWHFCKLEALKVLVVTLRQPTRLDGEKFV